MAFMRSSVRSRPAPPSNYKGLARAAALFFVSEGRFVTFFDISDLIEVVMPEIIDPCPLERALERSLDIPDKPTTIIREHIVGSQLLTFSDSCETFL
jgi:hypothetical protein